MNESMNSCLLLRQSSSVAPKIFDERSEIVLVAFLPVPNLKTSAVVKTCWLAAPFGLDTIGGCSSAAQRLGRGEDSLGASAAAAELITKGWK